MATPSVIESPSGPPGRRDVQESQADADHPGI
jgi:hypothetical protein